MVVFTKKKLKLLKFEYYSLRGKLNFSVIHRTNYYYLQFLKNNVYLKGFVYYRKKFFLAVKNSNDNCTF